MAEYIYVPAQEVDFRQGVLLNGSYPCNRGAVLHQNGSALFTLRGPSTLSGQCAARYQVTFVANIAIPTGGTVGEISVSITQNGEALGQSLAAYTPAAVNQYGNVVATTYLTVPIGCCSQISVQNTSATGETINVRNANLVITRIA